MLRDEKVIVPRGDTTLRLGDEVLVLVTGEGEDATRYTVKKLKFWDKTRALELLAKNLGLLVDRHEHTGAGDRPISISINGIVR